MRIDNLTFGYGKHEILSSVSADIKTGGITTILGPNGCGKSTLFNLMTKNLHPDKGAIYLDNKNIDDIKLKDFARRVAIVHQYNSAPEDITVENLVSYGRTPYLRLYKGRSDEDDEITEWAMKTTNVLKFKDKAVSLLSGGEMQRVWIAMALAQKTDILFLDEPTTYLDVRYQIEILELVRNLNRSLGITIVMVLHDINQAVCYSDEIIGLREGRIFVQGRTNDVVNSENLYRIFGINLKIIDESGRKYVLNVSKG